MKLYRYVGNAVAHDQTGAISFPDDDARSDINMGALGELEDHEAAALSSMGIVVQLYDDGGLGDKGVAELKKVAEKEGVELDDDDKKPQIVSKLRAAIATSGKELAAQAIGGTTEESMSTVGTSTAGATGGSAT